MGNQFIGLLVIILTIAGRIAFGTFSQSHPPEKAISRGLRIGYFSMEEGWTHATAVPVEVHQLQPCGMMARTKSAPLLFTITDPEGRNKYLHQKD
jgi:hypothetical protein